MNKIIDPSKPLPDGVGIIVGDCPPRHHAIYYLGYDFLKLLFARHALNQDFSILPVPVNLPDGTKVVSVNPCYDRHALAVLLEHPSFAPVAPGALAPVIDVDWRAYELKEK